MSVLRQESFISVACSFYNYLLDPIVWTSKFHLKEEIIFKFGEESLSEEEKEEGFDLREACEERIRLSQILVYLERHVGVVLRKQVFKRVLSIEKQNEKKRGDKQSTNIIPSHISSFRAGADSEEEDLRSSTIDFSRNFVSAQFEFSNDDFLEISSSVKGLKLSSMAIGEAIKKQAIQGNKPIKEKLRLLTRALGLMNEGSKGDILYRFRYIQL